MFLVLVALAGEARHGYAIMREVEEETGGAVRLGPGTLYRSIKRLLDDGLIEETNDPPDPDDPDDPARDARRRYYRITAPGERAARAEAERLDRVLRLARRSALAPVGAPAGAGGGS
jgi:DNA-binding PadR family transcriptional regulator